MGLWYNWLKCVVVAQTLLHVLDESDPTITCLLNRMPALCKTQSATTAMFAGRAESWNVRDERLAETLAWCVKIGPRAKIIVWPTIGIWAMHAQRKCRRDANRM